jgi:hypothetical protein
MQKDARRCFKRFQQHDTRASGLGALHAVVGGEAMNNAPNTDRTEPTVILEAGFEGGSLTMLGAKTPTGWRFRIAVDEGAIFDLLSDEDRARTRPSDFRRKSDWVNGQEAALALLNERRHWHMMSADWVHPDFRQRIWAAVQDRFNREASRRKNMDPGYERICRHQLDRWERVCHAKPPYPRARSAGRI